MGIVGMVGLEFLKKGVVWFKEGILDFLLLKWRRNWMCLKFFKDSI